MDRDLVRLFVVFNLCEGLLWIAVAVGFAVAYWWSRKNADLMLIGGLLFLAFGLSDFVEIRTGGWYKPWWLLAWKAGCLLGFALLYWAFRARRPMSVVAAPPSGQLGTPAARAPVAEPGEGESSAPPL